MSYPAVVVIALLFALAVGVAPTVWAAWRQRRAARRRRALPHRPAPGTAPSPRRHRAVNAHTGSLSAADLLAALEDEARR